MSTQLMEIGPDLYRISTYSEAYGIQFNQFLLLDDEPFLMHERMAHRGARRPRGR